MGKSEQLFPIVFLRAETWPILGRFDFRIMRGLIFIRAAMEASDGV